MNNMNENIDAMLAAKTFAVVGASTNQEKYGNKVFRSLKAHGKTAYPVNPRATVIEGDTAYPSVSALPEKPEVVVSIVPSKITEQLVDEMAAQGLTNLWIQPGAESAAAIASAKELGIATVHSGPCIMVGLLTHARR
jgi:uncharacterized protein